jgi:hypothetical protein
LQGQFEGAPYAIFQCKPRTGVDEASNNADLMAELKLLIHGQNFAESFAKRAQTYGVRIPGRPHLTVLYIILLTKVQIYAGMPGMSLLGLSLMPF